MQLPESRGTLPLCIRVCAGNQLNVQKARRTPGSRGETTENNKNHHHHRRLHHRQCSCYRLIDINT